MEGKRKTIFTDDISLFKKSTKKLFGWIKWVKQDFRIKDQHKNINCILTAEQPENEIRKQFYL